MDRERDTGEDGCFGEEGYGTGPWWMLANLVARPGLLMHDVEKTQIGKTAVVISIEFIQEPGS